MERAGGLQKAKILAAFGAVVSTGLFDIALPGAGLAGLVLFLAGVYAISLRYGGPTVFRNALYAAVVLVAIAAFATAYFGKPDIAFPPYATHTFITILISKSAAGLAVAASHLAAPDPPIAESYVSELLTTSTLYFMCSWLGLVTWAYFARETYRQLSRVSKARLLNTAGALVWLGALAVGPLALFTTLALLGIRASHQQWTPFLSVFEIAAVLTPAFLIYLSQITAAAGVLTLNRADTAGLRR